MIEILIFKQDILFAYK